MKKPLQLTLLSQPASIALFVVLIFAVRFLFVLPFSGNAQDYNYETVATFSSYLIYASEPFSFPLGAIKGLTFPFEDANIGNVGAIPLFAVTFKALGKIFPYFQTFNYSVLIELISCFTTAFFAQKILLALGVSQTVFRFLAALLTGTSFLLLTRSGWHQPFVVLSFPIFTVWIYAMLLTLQRRKWLLRQDILIVSIFPIAALTDNYSLVGILLATGVLLLREFFEAMFGGLSISWNRFQRIAFYCLAGVGLSLLALYIIGMFPLPAVQNTFTSYDFGIGGRYHGADLFAPWIPVASEYFVEPSLLGRLGFPINTDQLGKGQYEGVGYVGTAILFIWFAIVAIWLYSIRTNIQNKFILTAINKDKLVLYSPWKKIGLSAFFVFVFSLGYELHVFGYTFPNYSGMPAAWIADRFPSLYNIRATGRLASLLSFFLIIEALRHLFRWKERFSSYQSIYAKRFSYIGTLVIGSIILIHLLEIAPLLQPVEPKLSQPTQPISGVYTDEEIGKIRELTSDHKILLISPSVIAVDVKWTTEAYALAYYSGLRTNLQYIARPVPSHYSTFRRDLNRIAEGDWEELIRQYGNVIIAIPSAFAEKIRARKRNDFEETIIGKVSIWSKREDINKSE